ncbi:hypothetical protein QWI82_10840, partial [Acinetobacter baumannii]
MYSLIAQIGEPIVTILFNSKKILKGIKKAPNPVLFLISQLRHRLLEFYQFSLARFLELLREL